MPGQLQEQPIRDRDSFLNAVLLFRVHLVVLLLVPEAEKITIHIRPPKSHEGGLHPKLRLSFFPKHPKPRSHKAGVWMQPGSTCSAPVGEPIEHQCSEARPLVFVGPLLDPW